MTMNTARHRLWTGAFPDGSWLLVETFTDENVSEMSTTATKARGERTWSPPIPLDEKTDS